MNVIRYSTGFKNDHQFMEKTNLFRFQLDADYIPSVIPVDTAADGRCLCPTSEQHGACSCIAADWKKVRLHRKFSLYFPSKTHFRYSKASNRCEFHSPGSCHRAEEGEPHPNVRDILYCGSLFLFRVLYVILILVAILALMCGTVVFVVYFCKKLKPIEKTTRIRFVGNTMNGHAVAENQSPLIAQCECFMF